ESCDKYCHSNAYHSRKTGHSVFVVKHVAYYRIKNCSITNPVVSLPSHMIRTFFTWFIPALIGAVSLIWIGASLGSAALATAALLIVLEVTLSFDNAVVNAGVLRHMTSAWQWRFLTWGIAIAVFGSRALLPIVIVSISTWISPLSIAWIAIYNATLYGDL